MAHSGPIILIDDDADDEQLLREALQQLDVPNPFRYFDDTSKAFAYLKTSSESPFLIFSDVNMPRESGIEFKRRIDKDPHLRSKSIPFVFFSTAAGRQTVDVAYKEMTVQGFFTKPVGFRELTSTIGLILDYWRLCHHPNANK